MASSDAWKVHAALLLLQLNYGGYNVIAKLALSGGINQLVFCVLCDVVALVILGPLAYVKDKWGILFSPPHFFPSTIFFSLWIVGMWGKIVLLLLHIGKSLPFFWQLAALFLLPFHNENSYQPSILLPASGPDMSSCLVPWKIELSRIVICLFFCACSLLALACTVSYHICVCEHVIWCFSCGMWIVGKPVWFFQEPSYFLFSFLAWQGTSGYVYDVHTTITWSIYCGFFSIDFQPGKSVVLVFPGDGLDYGSLIYLHIRYYTDKNN